MPNASTRDRQITLSTYDHQDIHLPAIGPYDGPERIYLFL